LFVETWRKVVYGVVKKRKQRKEDKEEVGVLLGV